MLSFPHHVVFLHITMVYQAFPSPYTQVLLRLLKVSWITDRRKFLGGGGSLRTAVVSRMSSKDILVVQSQHNTLQNYMITLQTLVSFLLINAFLLGKLEKRFYNKHYAHVFLQKIHSSYSTIQ